MNLLTALDALLAEGSVTAAAQRLGLSTSAMSRTLGRLRAATGDPLLVRAGRRLVPTPHAAALRGRVHALARDVQAVLQPPRERFEVAALERTFTVRAGEGFVTLFAAPLVTAVTRAAPRVRLHFAARPDKAPTALREGRVDLEIGVAEADAPEIRHCDLFRDRYVGVVRAGHPLLHGPALTAQRYAACDHVVATPKGAFAGDVDEALQAMGLMRTVRVMVPGFPDALRVAGETDLVALVPRSLLGHDAAGGDHEAASLQAFELPLPTPTFTISAMWHPRMDADPAQRWLRQVVVELCRDAAPECD